MLTPADTLCRAQQPGHWRAHATCVAHGDHGLLILGKSGSGKSTLAAEMMAFGCALVADDAVDIRLDRADGVVCATPQNAPAQMELRGLGLLSIPLKASAKLAFCIVLSEVTPPRFPPEENVAFGDRHIPIYRTYYAAGLGAKLVVLLRHGGRTLRA